MSVQWQIPKASMMGIPLVSGTQKQFDGKIMSWLPGMRVDCADWYMILWHMGDIRCYREAGGDMGKVIVHHLSGDRGRINPLWGKMTFIKRIAKMRDNGVENIVAPDFSSWADYPLAVQIHNYYKSAVVSRDLTAYFNVIPNVAWSAPQIVDMALSMWSGDAKTILIDANHIATKMLRYNWTLFWNGAERIKADFPSARILLYASTDLAPRHWRGTIGECEWIPSRVAMLGRLSKHNRKREVKNG